MILAFSLCVLLYKMSCFMFKAILDIIFCFIRVKTLKYVNLCHIENMYIAEIVLTEEEVYIE